MANRLMSALAAGTLMAGCGSIVDLREENIPDAGVMLDAGIDAPDGDAGIQNVEKLTRGQLAIELKEKVLFYPDFEAPCTAPATDIAQDSKLCRAVTFLQARGVLTNYKDANGNDTKKFGPEDSLTNGKLWRTVAGGLQWPAFLSAQAPFPDLQNSDEATPDANALLEHGITVGQSDDLAHPFNPATSDSWNTMKGQLIDVVTTPLTRASGAELTGHSLLHLTPPAGQPLGCKSTFSDVSDDTTNCFYAQALSELGVMNGYADGTFKSQDQIIFGEIAHSYAKAKEWDTACTGCSGSPCDAWFSGGMDALCEHGIISNIVDPIKVPVWIDAAQIAWEIDSKQ